jgi:hypothetical protein
MKRFDEVRARTVSLRAAGAEFSIVDARSQEGRSIQTTRLRPEKYNSPAPSAALQPRVLLGYLRRLDRGRQILWCYAIWYAVVLVRYFDPKPELWLTSLGLSGIVGFALLLSTRAGATSPLAGWTVFRLFLMPFCVSSFAALVKGRGFLLIFSPRVEENLFAVGTCLLFWIAVAGLKRWRAV